MPGHLVDAACPCGYSKEQLAPGCTDLYFRLHVIAYTKDGKDLETFDETDARDREQKIISNPFLSDSEPEDALDKFMYEEIEKKKIPHGPYQCPKCGRSTLTLRFGGWSD
jgi:hypothetical protein